MKNDYGFTLIEVLIAMLVTAVIMTGAYAVFNSQQKNTTIQTNVSDAQQVLRAAMDFMARDIRMAGYDPEESKNFSITDISFDANGKSTITFTWDKNSDGSIDSDETIGYSLSGTNLIYNSGANNTLAANIIALGLAFAYDVNGDGELDTDSLGNVIWGIDNSGTWDSLTVNQAAGTIATSSTGTTISTKDIRAVRIWMLARSDAPAPNYTDTKTYVVGPTIVTPNDNYRHRMLERTVLCRNMGLNL